MTTASVPKRMTVGDWFEYDVPDGRRTELVDGELVMNPLPNYAHQRVVHQFNRILLPYHLAHPDIVNTLMIPARVILPEQNEGREPDLALYSQEPPDRESPEAWAQIKPFLVIEVVSPRQESRDYIDKYRTYHRAEIAEYWIADPERQLFTALRWTPERWVEQIVAGSGQYTTPALPELVFEIANLWL